MESKQGAAERLYRGRWGESLAAAYLELTGYRIEARNLRAGHREIDLVARRGDLICLVEVRLRRRGGLVPAIASLDPQKQRHLRRAAGEIARAFPARAWRQDLIAIDWQPDAGLVLTHVPGVRPG